MIRDLYIENFQSHRTNSLSFGPGVNVITGTSDSGKSAIIRALIWVIANRPSGDAIRNWNAKAGEPTTVTIGLEDDLFVEKTREGGKTVYRRGQDETVETFQAVRSDVPEPVIETLSMVDYNIQTQHQPYFLLQDTPGERAARLNELVDLEVIDRIFKKITARVQQNRTNTNFYYSEVTKAEQELEKLSYIDAADVAVKKIESAIAECKIISAKTAALRSAVETLTELNTLKDNLAFYFELEQAAAPIITMIADHDFHRRRNSDLAIMVGNIEQFAEDIASYKDWLNVESFIPPIKEKLTEAEAIDLRILSLRRTIVSMEATNTNLYKARKEAADKVAQYKDMLTKAGVCPVCKSKIDQKVIKHIEEAL